MATLIEDRQRWLEETAADSFLPGAAELLPRERQTDTVEVYQSPRSKDWYWRRRAANGNIIADSGEGYRIFDECCDMAVSVNFGVPYGQFVVLDES